jgi:hypothetical protein
MKNTTLGFWRRVFLRPLFRVPGGRYAHICYDTRAAGNRPAVDGAMKGLNSKVAAADPLSGLTGWRRSYGPDHYAITMSEPVPVRFTAYQEAHSALSWPLLACGLLVPAAAEIAFVILGIVVNPQWFVAIPFLPLFVPFMIYIGLLYRNWPTGIRIDESAISIGAIRSARATRRTPTVNHQSWGLFTCPWPAVEGVRVVTDRAELRQMKNSPRYYTLTNRWANNAAISDHCNTGVLAAPFMRAALVIHVDPHAVTTTQIRPARFFKPWRYSHLVRPELSRTWVAPTRHPEALSKAFEALPSNQGAL